MELGYFIIERLTETIFEETSFLPIFQKKISWKLVDDSTQPFIFQPMQG